MPGSEPVIQVQGLTKRFGKKTVVRSVDMEVNAGEIYGFMGPNGSGKTTFIRMLCGLLQPDGGGGTCLGYDIISQADRIKPQVGYMAQRFSLYEELTVYENLDFVARLYRLKKRKAEVKRIIERMGLDRYIHHLAGNLSGGWKQRLALAAAILHGPRLLLLDEPTAGVDPAARRDFWDEVHKLAAEGVTALISTHYMDEAERCHRLAYIAYGDLLASGTPESLVENAELTTWAVTGPRLQELADRLRPLAGVDQAVIFGNRLHVSGKDPAKLKSSLESALKTGDYRIQESQTRLEELFIHLMQDQGKIE